MNYTRALKRYYSIEKRVKKERIQTPLVFKNNTETINNFLTFFTKDNKFQDKANFEFINFLFNLEFEDENINEPIQEILHNLQKSFKYAGSSVLSAYSSCLWKKYDEIGLLSKLSQRDLNSFRQVASKDTSADIDLFFKDAEDAYIFSNIIHFKLNELNKFFKMAISELPAPKDKDKRVGFGHISSEANKDIINFFKYQDPLYKVNITQSIKKIKENLEYRSLIDTKDEIVNIKFRLCNSVADTIGTFVYRVKDNIENPKALSSVLNYDLTQEGKDLMFKFKADEFIPVLNCILPDGDTRTRDRVPYFDILNCSLIWDITQEEFVTKSIQDDNNYESEAFRILLKPWELLFNSKYVKEHYQPSYRNIDIIVNHPIDFFQLEEELNLDEPETELDLLLKKPESLERETGASTASKGFLVSKNDDSDELTNIFLKMVPENIDINGQYLRNYSFRNYKSIAYNEIISDKVLRRINKYKNKGYLVNQESNLIPLIITSKFDNICNLFDDEGMLTLLNSSVDDLFARSQDMLITGHRKNEHQKNELTNVVSNLETVSYFRDTINTVYEMRKAGTMKSNIKKLSYDEDIDYPSGEMEDGF